MSAGTGVLHSEFNHAEGQITHFLQIWILPNVKGIPPSYEQKTFSDDQKRGKLRLVISPDGTNGSVLAHADARMYAGLFDGNEAAKLTLDSARNYYVHVVRGELDINQSRLSAGDAAALKGERMLDLGGGEEAEVLVFDLAPI